MEKERQIKAEIYNGNLNKKDELKRLKEQQESKDRMYLEQKKAEEEADKWLGEENKKEKLNQQTLYKDTLQ